MVTREEWARSFLKLAGWPESRKNLVALVAWQAAEGSPDNPPQAKWNPLNTTQPWAEATVFNSVGVRNYASKEDGLNATLRTINGSGHGYEPIRRRLKRSANPRRTLDAVESSAWGTGGLARSIVDDVKNSWEAYSGKAIGQ
jgi:hypothetical protein